MKHVLVVITLLVLTGLLVTSIGIGRQQLALAQDEQPPVPPVIPVPVSEPGRDLAVPTIDNNLSDGDEITGGEIDAYPYRQMSYQGRLLDNGAPCQGSKQLTFRLWDASTGGGKYWEETQTVNCENGLFSVMLGAVNPLPKAVNFQFELWLGIQPQGAAAELSPRQLLGTVPYAMNLLGGATMVDTNPVGDYGYSLWVHSFNHAGIYASSDYTDTVAIMGNANGAYSGGVNPPVGVYGTAGDGYGVRGTSDYMGVRGDAYVGVMGLGDRPYSYGIYGTTAYTGSLSVYGSSTGNNSFGVYGSSNGIDSPGVFGVAYGNSTSCSTSNTFCNAGMVSQTFGNSYGNFSYSGTNGRSAYIAFGKLNGYYTAFFNNLGGTASSPALGTIGSATINGNLTVTGSKSGYVVDIVLNAGTEPLERGDVVAVVGVDTPILGEIPVMRVEKANAANASAIVGVVDKLYEACAKSPEELQPGEACGGFKDDVTTIQPGQYMGVVTLGAYGYLKVDTTSGAIHAGDLLSVSKTQGVAGVAQQISVEGVSFYAPGTIIGKALGELEAGSGYIAVFVSLK
jgi:hypothetical protein